MPTYDYRCENCEHEFEAFQSMKARPLRKCPQCGKNKVKRLIGTGAAIIFKGSGFYQTDYRSESYKAGEKKANESKNTKSKDTKSKDSKSDGKKVKAGKSDSADKGTSATKESKSNKDSK